MHNNQRRSCLRRNGVFFGYVHRQMWENQRHPRFFAGMTLIRVWFLTDFRLNCAVMGPGMVHGAHRRTRAVRELTVQQAMLKGWHKTIVSVL